MLKATSILVLVIIYLGHAQGYGCPPANLIAPCECIGNDITCHETDVTADELKAIFDRISKQSPEVSFYHLDIWRNNKLTELKANTFGDAVFEWIEISVCPNLVDIHPDAFKGTDVTAKDVRFSSTGIGRSKNQTIFDVINKFVNAKEIHLHDNGHDNTTIPAGAFTKLRRLDHLEVQNERFGRIASGAFNVDNIFVLDLFWTNISYIEDNALYSEKTVDNHFILNLMDNRLLSGDSFAEKAFSNIQKPTRLYLGHFLNDMDYWRTPITYLPEKTFLPFLKKQKTNTITLTGVDYHLDCNDCRNAWIAKNPKLFDQFSDGGFFKLTCDDKRKLNDPNVFKNCTNISY